MYAAGGVFFLFYQHLCSEDITAGTMAGLNYWVNKRRGGLEGEGVGDGVKGKEQGGEGGAYY